MSRHISNDYAVHCMLAVHCQCHLVLAYIFTFSSLFLSLSLSPPPLAIASFLKFCGDLISPEVTRRLMLPLDSALAMLSGLV